MKRVSRTVLFAAIVLVVALGGCLGALGGNCQGIHRSGGRQLLQATSY